MALFDVNVVVQYLDSAERTAEVSYTLREQYDDTANAGVGNFADIITDAVLLIAALNTLSWDAIVAYTIDVIFNQVGQTPNVSANNQVRAFSRVTDAAGGSTSFEVPAWDDFVYDQDDNNLLSAAYNTVAGAVAALIKDPDTGEDMSSVDWSQSRTRKSRATIQ